MKGSVVSRNFNLDSYWDCVQVKSGYAIGSVSGSIVIPANSLVQEILAQITQKVVTLATGTSVFIVGDSSDTDGYLKSSDATAASGTIYGNDVDEVGDYLLQTTGMQPVLLGEEARERLDTERQGKFLLNGGTITVTLTTGTLVPTREGIVTVWVKIIHFITSVS